MTDKPIIDRLANAFAAAERWRVHSRLAALAERQGLLDVSYRTVDSPLGLLAARRDRRGVGARWHSAARTTTPCLARLASDISPRILRPPRAG